MMGFLDRFREVVARFRGLPLPRGRKPTAPPADVALLYDDVASGKLTLLRPDGSTVEYAAGGGGGSSDHATLSNLAWTSSGHTGTASRLAGFDGSGATTTYQIGASGGVQAWDADLDAYAALSTTGLVVRTGAGTATTAAMPRAIFAVPDDFAPPSGWSVDSYGMLVQMPRTWQDVANAATSVPAGWTFSDTSSRLSAASITSGVLLMDHNTTGSSGYGSGTTSSPHFRRTMGVLPGVTWQRTYRIRLSNFSATDAVSRAYVGTSTGSSVLGADILSTSGTAANLRLWAGGSITTPVTGASTSVAAAGWWVRETVDTFSGASIVEYQTASSDTEPTTGWLFGRKASTSSLADPTVTSWTIAFAVSRGASGTGPRAEFTLGSERLYDEIQGGEMPYLGAGYSTSASDFVLYDDVYVYDATDAAITAALATRLAAIVNTIPGRSSTWTAKIERSSTAGTYSGGTFNALGSLTGTISGSGSYCRVTMRSTAGSTAAGGSLDLRRATFLLT